jgi:hypothetical protein
VAIVAVDPLKHTFTASLAHLSRFAAGVQTQRQWLYLPAVGK